MFLLYIYFTLDLKKQHVIPTQLFWPPALNPLSPLALESASEIGRERRSSSPPVTNRQ
jgi:hypothetical protein